MNDHFLGEVKKRLQEIFSYLKKVLNNFFQHKKILHQQKQLFDYIITLAHVFDNNQIFPLFYIMENIH